MKRPKIVVHCLVKNEENFIWYAINSVLPFVDKIMVWDNGSTDKTVEIINTINSPKIEFENHPVTTREEVGHLRQEMLEKSTKEFDWLLVLDGDEIWPKLSLQKVVKYLFLHPKTESIANWTTNLVGDIYHALPITSGNYQIAGKKGNLNLHLISLKNIPGLHAANPYGQEGYFDKNNLAIQQRKGVVFLDINYFHATHLPRSSQNVGVIDREKKLKYQMGIKIPQNKIPSIFFSQHPPIVPVVNQAQNPFFIFIRYLNSIWKYLQRKIIQHGQ